MALEERRQPLELPEHKDKKETKKHKKKEKKRRRHEGEEEEAAGGCAPERSDAVAAAGEEGSPKKHRKKKKKRRRVEEGEGQPAAASSAETEQESEPPTPKTAAGLTGFSAAARARFPELSPKQWRQLEELGGLVQEWNGKVNVISRKDIENVLPRHVLPCMGIAKLLARAPEGTRLMDVGTGGGFPGLVLAVCCPQIRFLLVDSIGKKIRVVQDMARRLGLGNVEARHTRVEEVRERVHFVTGRSVTAMARFVGWVQHKFVGVGERLAASAALLGVAEHEPITGGILYIKGGIGEDVKGQEEDLGGWVPTGRHPITELIGGGPRVYDGDKAVLHFDLECLRRGPKGGAGGGGGGMGGVVAAGAGKGKAR